MSQLQADLLAIERQEKSLAERKKLAISAAPRTFEHLDTLRGFGRDRYLIVQADGTRHGYHSWLQRAAAFHKLRALARRYDDNLYLYDLRTGEVLGVDENVVHRAAS